MKKELSIREQREARKAEMKEKYKKSAANTSENWVGSTPSAFIKRDNSENNVNVIPSASVNVEDNSETNLDIESKNEKISLYKIICELKQTKEEKKAGKKPKTFTLGEYIDANMRDRAYEALKTSISRKHDVKDAGNENLCFIVSGVNQYFEQFKHKVYKFDSSLTVNVLDRNRISRFFDIEV